MNKLLSFTGGKPDFNIDDILWNDEATRDALNDIFRAFGDNYIIYGVTGTTSITAGYIMLDGEILKVDAHTKTDAYFAKVTTYAAGGDVTYNDGLPRQTWQQNRATISAASGNLAYATALRLSDMNLSKIVDIGDWDMNGTTKISVAHGLSDITKIRGIKVIIRDDTNTIYSNLNSINIGGTAMNGGAGFVDATNIALIRAVGGEYDTGFYQTTSYNRGYIIFDLND